MNFEFIIKLFELPSMYFLLAGILFCIDILLFRNFQNILKFHWKTLFFLIAFFLLLIGLQKENGIDGRSALIFISICLAILFFFLNKSQISIAKEKAIEATNQYNTNIINNIILIMEAETNRRSKFFTIPFLTDTYKDYIDYIFFKSN